jgi:hypothetical protein
VIPALGGAYASQAVLREYDVGVCRCETVARAITDEDDDTSGRLMEPDTLALARPADVARRMAVREAEPRAAAPEGVLVRGHRDVGNTEPRQVGSDVEAEPVAHDLDVRAPVADGRDEGREPLVVRHLGCGAAEQLLVARKHVHVPDHQLARAEPTGVVERVLLFQFLRVVEIPLEQRVAHVDARNRPVVVDEEADRCETGLRWRDGGSGAVPEGGGGGDLVQTVELSTPWSISCSSSRASSSDSSVSLSQMNRPARTTRGTITTAASRIRKATATNLMSLFTGTSQSLRLMVSSRVRSR